MLHEHLLTLGEPPANYLAEIRTATEVARYHQPLSMALLGWIRYQGGRNLENESLLDVDEAIEAVQLFKQFGGGTLVDVTPDALGRDPIGLARIARATGVNVVMGGGYFEAVTHPPDMDAKTEVDIAEEFVRDITVGVRDTGIRTGILGEIGCSWPMQENERKVLRAAARAQQRTGVASPSTPAGTRRRLRRFLRCCERLVLTLPAWSWATWIAPRFAGM